MSEVYKPNGAPLTERQREILVIFMEECCEAAHAAAKVIRFGWGDIPPGGRPNNQTLGNEIGDLEHMIQLLHSEAIVTGLDILVGKTAKRDRLAKFLQSKP